MLALAETWLDLPRRAIPAPRALRTARQLRPHEVDDLVAGYRDGQRVRELAAQFGISRGTVGQHLRARGIETKPPGLQPDEVPEAARLYRAGWSLARIAEMFGTTDYTVRAHLRSAGMQMRRPYERVV
ncbi:hypothetical protein [Actinophytocola glycyrrhizae]|uniref:Helix-turn-helix domain-containing protein n=1 Tax=Actinophytocola glycyrrhizae TaxID=2044873 RepID=A0ABV9SCJ0_9PSEU